MRRLALLLAFVTVGCGQKQPEPELGRLYSRAAQSGVQETRPVVVIPGILGSRLVDGDSGRVVWGAFGGDFANPGRADGARLVALPMREGATLAELTDAVEPTGVLDTLEVDVPGLGLPITLAAYVDILTTLGVGGYRDRELSGGRSVNYGSGHFTCFQFAYDWRRDNAEAAGELYRFLLRERENVAARLAENMADAPAAEEIRFDLVAHSMGGLVARYMLRYGDQPLPADGSMPELTWAGAKLVDRVILVGTPNAGSAEALRQLVEGKDFGPLWLPTAPAAVLGTLPGVYQLLPRPRHGPLVRDGRAIDFYDPQFWIDGDLGLADPDQLDEVGWIVGEDVPADARRRLALDHLRKCLANAEQFHRAVDLPAKLPEGVELHLFAGDAEETTHSLEIDSRGRLDTAKVAAGDGTVLRSSALMDERLDGDWTPTLRTPIDWTNVTFLFEDHLGLTRSATFDDNVLYLLLEAPRD